MIGILFLLGGLYSVSYPVDWFEFGGGVVAVGLGIVLVVGGYSADEAAKRAHRSVPGNYPPTPQYNPLPPLGPPADRYCPSCGTGNTRAAAYCQKCGKQLPPPQ